MKKNMKPELLGGIGEINYGTQYRQGNRVYDSRRIAMAVTASPPGNAGGYTYLYMVIQREKVHLCSEQGS